MHDSHLASIRQLSLHQLECAGLLSGDTITYDLGKPVSALARVGIGQSGISSSGNQTERNDFIRTLTLQFASDATFTHTVSTQQVNLIDNLPYQQVPIAPVMARFIRVGASSLFSKHGTNTVALTELQFYTAVP